MADWRFVIKVVVLLLLGGACSPVASNTYTIRKGDTLQDIARRFRVSAEDIRAENSLESDKIRVGDRLRIPSAGASGRVAGGEVKKNEAVRTESDKGSIEAVQAPIGPPQIHMIRPGETLWSLSRRYDVSTSELRRLNHLDNEAVLRVATPLVIREVLPETHTVAEGESLSRIAQKFGMAVGELKDLNDLESDVVTPGQQLALFERGDEPENALADESVFIPSENGLAEASFFSDDNGEPARERVVRVAKTMLNTPYRWGGTSAAGMDCSGFVWKVFTTVDMNLPRSAREQYQLGSEVSRNSLSVGDLIFFRTYARYPSHVGIYMGGNQFIHASSVARRVKISSMDHSYYKKRYIGAKRLF